MTVITAIVALVLLTSLALGLVRIASGPTVADSLLGVQFTATIGIGLLPVIGIVRDVPSLIDLALVLAILGVPATLAFARLGTRASDGGQS